MTYKVKIPHWMKRFSADFVKKEFIPLKVLFFVIYGASMTMFPFLTLQARSLGINEKEIGIVYAVQPIIAIFGPPLTGILADKIGNFKFYLSLTMAASGCAALTFAAVPQGRLDHHIPDDLPLNVTCAGLLGVEPDLALDLSYRCDYLDDLNSAIQRSANVTIQSCTLCGTNRSLTFVAEEERQLCEEEGPTSVGCLISQHLSNVTHQMVVQPVREVERNISRLQVLNWSCPKVSLESIDLAVADSVADPRADLPVAADCSIRCQATVPRDDLCANKVTQELFDPILTFWLYLFVRVLNTLTLATSFTLFDGAAIAVVKEHKGDYGLQRLYANLGGIVLTPIAGQLIDYFSRINGVEDYRPTFYMYCSLKILASIIILFVDLDFRQPSNQVLKDLRHLIKKPEIVVFLLVLLTAGTCYGLLDTFLFWLLQDLGASKFLMGLTVTVGNVAGVPILIASGSIFKKLGYANTIVFGLIAYFVRFIGYSYLTNAWWCMPFECLECFTVSLLGTAAVSYAADLATPSTLATLQGVYGGLHYGVGRGIGSLFGGFLLQPIGVRNTFTLMGVISAVIGITYFFVNRVFFQKLQDERRKIAEEVKRKGKKEEMSNDTIAAKEMHNGIVENGVKIADKGSISLESVTHRENSTVVKEVDNAAFVVDE